jgi:hypothetical protein
LEVNIKSIDDIIRGEWSFKRLTTQRRYSRPVGL